MINTSVMTGLMELTPAQQLEFDRMKSIIQEEYAHFGFTAIDTPVLERADVLLAKAGGETEKQIYRFMKGDTDIAMRFDLTVPLARYVAEHYGSLVFPFRRSHIAKVYRGERPQKGRYREFYQCDVDVIGEETLDIAYDAELPRIIYAIFTRLAIGDFTIRINNRKILSGFMKHLGAEDQSAALLRAIDKKEKLSAEAFLDELRTIGLNELQVADVSRFTSLQGGTDEIIQNLRDMGISNAQFTQGLDELEQVVRLVRTMGVPDVAFTVDVSIARGLDYYTGTVFETTLNEYPQLGSICSGGRYDDLASHYTKKQLPGVGVSIGLTRLFSQLVELGIVNTDVRSVADALVIPLSDDELPYAYRAAEVLRKEGLCIDVYLESQAMKKKFKYADRIGVRYAVIVGKEEVQKNAVTVQDMTTGEKSVVSVEDAAQYLRRHQ